jgi:hypothetical protein
MPKVPTYDNFQVMPGTLPQARVQAQNMPDVAGAQLQNTGRALMGLGQDVGRIQLEAAKQADQVRLNDAMNKAVQAKLRLTYDPNEGFVHLKGDAALTRPDGKSLDTEYGERYQQELDAIEQGLGNENQRLAFRQQSGQLSNQFRGSTTQHVAKEYGDFQVSVQQGTIKTGQQQMSLAWGDAEAVSQSVNAIKAATAETGRLQGWSAKQTEAATVEALSPGHASVVSAAIDAGKLDYAREYMKQNTAELTPQARLQLTKVLDEGTFETTAQANTEKFITQAGGDTAKALELARASLTGKDEDAVVQRIKVIDSEKTALRERDQKAAADEAWKSVAGGRMPPPSVMARLDGRDAIAIRKQLSEGSPRKTDVSKWLEFTNKSPAELAQMDPAVLLREYRAHFSDADLRNANEMILGAKGLKGGKGNNDGLQIYTTTDVLTRSAREMGILPKSGNKVNPKQDQAFSEYQEKMQVKVNAWEAANKKKASPEVLASLVNEEKMNKVYLDTWGSDEEKAVIALSDADIPKAYVRVGEREIKLTSIPVDYRASATRRIQSKGLPVTEQLIAQMWAADNPKK